MQLTSSAFAQNERIPDLFTGFGADVSPPLRWVDLPGGTQELALICEDPDAPTEKPWVHWVLYGLSPSMEGLPEGIPRMTVVSSPIQAIQGRNSWPTGTAIGYQGPEPPKGHGVHRYFFVLYALDRVLGLSPGASKETLLNAMEGHVLEKAVIMGTYEVQ